MNKSICGAPTTPTSLPAAAIHHLNYNWGGWGLTQSEARIKTNFLTLVRQKPEAPEQWATLTEAWEVACEYKPTVEDFRLLAEFLWENQDSVEVDIDLTFRTLYCHNRFFRNF